jgi:Domain of unknown function (DUF6362)
MARLAAIDFETAAGRIEPPAQWSGLWVRVRLVEAYATERRLPGRRGNGGNGWPAVVYEFADIVGWDDARERVWEAWENTRGGVFASEIARMEQAHDWLALLRDHPIDRMCLASWAAMIAYRRSLRRVLKRRGWARSTFYRHAMHGSILIARFLNHDGVEVS